MTLEEAQAAVERALNKGYVEPDDSIVILEEATLTKPYGWVFFCQSRRFVEVGDWSYQLLGNGPTIVLKDGSLHPLGSAGSPDDEIAAFEERHGLGSGLPGN